jgi:hypothetical protein
MKKKDDAATSAMRVKAFRERLSEGSYKRVEGYITREEKARIDALKAELGVTTDVAIAGLLRMGLEQYENRTGLAEGAALVTAQMEAPKEFPPLATQGFSMLSNNNDASFGAAASLVTFTTNAVAASNSAPGVHPVVAHNFAALQSTNYDDNNPIARFFKSRKEITNNA